jgi:hypothetical protein
MKKMLLFATALLCASCSNEGPNSPVAAVSTNTTFEFFVDGKSSPYGNGAFHHTVQRSSQLRETVLLINDPDGIERCDWTEYFPYNREPQSIGMSSGESDSTMSIITGMPFDSIGTYTFTGHSLDRSGAKATFSMIVTVIDTL